MNPETHKAFESQISNGFSPQKCDESHETFGREDSLSIPLNENWRTLRLLYADYKHAQGIRISFASWERDRKQRIVGTPYEQKLSIDPLFWVDGMAKMLETKKLVRDNRVKEDNELSEKYFSALMKAELECNRTYKEFIEPMRGISAITACGLLGMIGDPERFRKDDTGRGLRSLWHYASLHVNGDGSIPKRRRGMTQEEAKSLGVNELKTLLHMTAENFRKSHNEHYTELINGYKQTFQLKHPKKQGTKYSKGHADNHALRLTSKQFLKDLWRYWTNVWQINGVLHQPETQVFYESQITNGFSLHLEGESHATPGRELAQAPVLPEPDTQINHEIHESIGLPLHNRFESHLINGREFLGDKQIG